MATYMQIYADTKNKILKGLLQPGQKLPPHRELCGAYSASIDTITRAINRLKKEGYVQSYRGMGTIVAEKPELAGQPKTNTISLVSFHQHFMQDAFSYVTQQVFANTPWSLHSRCTHSNLEWYRNILEDCHKNPPAGMILWTMHPSVFQYDPALLPKPCTKVVLLEHEIPGRRYDLVRLNGYACGEMIAEYLLEKGYQDIVFLSDAREEEMRTSPCLQGIGSIFHCHGLAFGPEQCFSYENPHSFGEKIDPFIDAYNYVKDMLTRRRPRVIIAGHDWCAVGAIRAIRDAGLSVPEDIAVVSTTTEVDLSAITATPKITGVDTLFTYRCRAAAEILHARLEGDEGPIMIRETTGRIREGETA